MWDNSKQAWAGRCLVLPAFIFSLTLLTTTPLKAEPQIMIYDVYAGGIHGLEAELVIDTETNPKDYEIKIKAKTRGWLGNLVPWAGRFETEGLKQNASYKPETHRSVGLWRGEEQTKTYTYNKDGKFKSLVIKDHDTPESTRQIDPKLADYTIDILTATLKTMHQVDQGEACSNQSQVFDGKRRFEMTFNLKDEVMAPKSRYNVMEGPAQICTVEVTPIAGGWHKKPRGWFSIQEQGREQGKMPSVWFTKVDENALPTVGKVRVDTDYGVLFLHLSEYKRGDTHLIAAKRK